MSEFLVIGLGGFLGANARYFVGLWAAQRFGASFPYGTLLVNLSGSFLLGLFLALIANRTVGNPEARFFFAIGFLGAYTTFSTFTYESLVLLQSRAYLEAATNLGGSLVLGMLAVGLGVAVGRLL